jgi:hypothetical protein
MKFTAVKHLSVAGAFLVVSATAAAACPWGGGTYKGNEANFRTEFTVSADCAEMVFQSSGSAGFQEADTPATFALTEAKQGWQTEIHGVQTTLKDDGKWIRFVGPGGDRQLRVDR